MSSLSWRSCQAYLVLFALVSLLSAGWIYRYWSRGERSYAGDELPRLTQRLPGAIRDGATRRGVKGALEAPALSLWVFGPIVLPIVAVASGVALVFLRRRRPWALIATLLLALVALPVIYGGGSALHGIEDRHYFARSPYVRTYRYLTTPLLAGSVVLLALVTLDGVVLARRRR